MSPRLEDRLIGTRSRVVGATIPDVWTKPLARRGDIEILFGQFIGLSVNQS